LDQNEAAMSQMWFLLFHYQTEFLSWIIIHPYEIYDVQMTYKNKPTFVACRRCVVAQETHNVVIVEKYSQQDEET
jgi:hypothetical protein